MSPVDVILLRGLGRERKHWGLFLEQLQKQEFIGHVQAIDLLGTGDYHKLSSPISIHENAQFVLSQIRTENFSKGIIVSVSLGSMVAIEMAQIAPDLFSKVFVMNTSFANLSPVLHRLQLHALKQFYAMGKAKGVEQREAEILKMVSRRQDKHEELAKSWGQIATERPIKIQNVLKQLVAAGTYKVSGDPPGVPIVVMNSQGDEMVNPKCSEKLAEHWSLPLITHPSAGHDICVDDPQWVIDTIKNNI